MSAHRVQIVVRGHLGHALVSALDGFNVEHAESGVTRVTGLVSDQSMLFGILEIFDGLNIEVLSVNRVDGADEEVEVPG